MNSHVETKCNYKRNLFWGDRSHCVNEGNDRLDSVLISPVDGGSLANHSGTNLRIGAVFGSPASDQT
jgi:hypothetical protein